ncbi:MAG: hypothetical protein QOI06_1827 [Nocardioidaceae bacterium]|jgi:hypothetical protein|nr:hypothetical protein [Nocardioidaceae bacterium]
MRSPASHLSHEVGYRTTACYGPLLRHGRQIVVGPLSACVAGVYK